MVNRAAGRPVSHWRRECMVSSPRSPKFFTARAHPVKQNRVPQSGMQSKLALDLFRVMDDDFRQRADLVLPDMPRRPVDAEARDGAPGAVQDRRADAADAGLVLALVDRVSAGTDQPQLALERVSAGDRGLG